MKRTCLNCKKEFFKKPTESKKFWENKKFCSKECHYEHGREKKKCLNCKQTFKTKKALKQIKFCSPECRAEYKSKNPDKYNLFKEGHKGYISKPWLGKKLSENHKKNISKSNSQSTKTLEHLKDIGLKHSGKNHWNWKGGITDELRQLRQTEEYQFWRNKVYARDNWTCQKCNKKLKDLCAHHIKSFKDYPELRYNVSNGQTLCRSCHKKVHEEIGKQTRWKKKQ